MILIINTSPQGNVVEVVCLETALELAEVLADLGYTKAPGRADELSVARADDRWTFMEVDKV